MNRTAIAALALVLGAQSAARPEPEWAWLEKIRTVAFEALMPMEEASDLLVAYRVYRDLYHDSPERYFRIAEADGRRLTATTVLPAGKSIQRQLLELHARDPDASVERLLSEIFIQRVVMNEKGVRLFALASSVSVHSR